MKTSLKRKRQSTPYSAISSTKTRSTSTSSVKRPSLIAQNSPHRVSRLPSGVGPARRTTREPSVQSTRPSVETPAPFRTGHLLEDEDSKNSLDHIIMAVDIKERDKVGCAYYVAREERLFCMEDVVGGGQDLIESLQVDLKPTVVIMSTRIDAGCGEADPLRKARLASLIDSDEDHLPLPYALEVRPNAEFGLENAKDKLVGLDILQSVTDAVFLVPGESTTYDDVQSTDEIGLTNRPGRVLQISALLDLENRISVGCVGAVIAYLNRKKASEFLQDDPDKEMAYRIQRLEMFTIHNTMLINADTLSSLQIIQPESHPNAFNQGPGTSGAKESLSIYGLFHHLARTPQGKTRLRQYFLRPSLDISELSMRLDFVSVFTRTDNQNSAQKLSKSMSKIKNMRSTMTLLHKGINGGNRKLGGFKSGVWASLLEFCYHSIDIANCLNELVGAESLSLRARGLDLLDKFQLQRIGKIIHDGVDLDQSIEQHRTVIKYGVSEALDNVKEMYDGMDALLTRAAKQLTDDIAQDIDLNVSYIPQLGFHIMIPKDANTGEATYSGGVKPWERIFTTDESVYFKDNNMHNMDSELGDLYAMICDLEIEISYDLAQSVLQEEKFLVEISDLCGEIDCLVALALGATQHKLTRPRLTEENVISIKGCRHLLQEMTVPSYVPNDIHVVGGQGRVRSQPAESETSAADVKPGPSMLLLTGPNYSGKSIYQKQVALTVYMAHIGSFVPADSATIGLTDKILTRINTRETVSKTQSAFTIDLQQISLAINHCTRRSLVVIDEFGKGTDSCDGAGLAAGVFHHFLSLGADSPKVIAATHFHEIFDNDFVSTHQNVAFAHMEVRVDRKGKRKASDSGGSEVTYLYNLKEGRSTLSYGTQCAAMNGVPGQVVERAVELAERVSRGEDLVALCASVSADEREELEDAEACARAFLAEELKNEGRDLVDLWESVLGESVAGSVS